MESSLVFIVILNIVSFKWKHFQKYSVFHEKKILQDCVLAVKAIDDGVAPPHLPRPGGIEPLHRLLRWRYDPTEPLEVSFHWLFYYVIPETKPQFFYNPIWKMKVLSVGIDPDHIGFTSDHLSAELFDLQ